MAWTRNPLADLETELEQKTAEMFCGSAALKLILSEVCLVHLQAMLPLQGKQEFKLSISSGVVTMIRGVTWSQCHVEAPLTEPVLDNPIPSEKNEIQAYCPDLCSPNENDEGVSTCPAALAHLAALIHCIGHLRHITQEFDSSQAFPQGCCESNPHQLGQPPRVIQEQVIQESQPNT
ncbi:hypothetical protein HGM15179_007510 [Zosterops borbonicus]|uniref:Uncharacterized protein n=1 Tax=Zosterops borbonicus TaxID=364589 RepID=A0A8K1GKE4_9PASS|nr:hypothetical protein HGM15179_007510 [Zosterops borbonicus]